MTKTALLVLGSALVLAAAGLVAVHAIDDAKRAEVHKAAMRAEREAAEAQMAERKRQYELRFAEIRKLRKQIADTEDDDERARLSERLAEAKKRYRMIDRPDAEAPWETDIILPSHEERIP